MAQATTSILLSALRGKAGSVVFVNTKTGVTVRARNTPANPQTPLQQATRQAMHRASALFSSFDPSTVKMWNDYARTLKTFDERSGKLKCPSGQNVFAGLACKLWQMDTGQDVPLSPPASAFLGDGITVDASVNGSVIVFNASGPNSASVVTELLTQPLKSGARTPQARAYRTASFVTMTPRFPFGVVEGLTGWVACAVRFVNTDTGQQSQVLELGVVQVGDNAGSSVPAIMEEAGGFHASAPFPSPHLDLSPPKRHNTSVTDTLYPPACPCGGIDLHAHTNASDGSLTPTELVQKAAAQGLSALAVTDHDTISGLEEAEAEARKAGLDFVNGVELSVEDDAGRFHMLGYGFARTPVLEAALIRLRRSRAERNALMGARMAELGLPITLQDVYAEAGPDAQVVARPHFAQALIKAGVVANVSQAFDEYLSVGRPLYLPKDVLSPAQAAELLHAAGGVTVLAHPSLVPLSEEALAERVRSLADAGVLDGVEALYSQHSPADTERFLALAKQFNLLVTGGSDFHGTPKPHVSLGIVHDDKPAPRFLWDSLQARLTGNTL